MESKTSKTKAPKAKPAAPKAAAVPKMPPVSYLRQAFIARWAHETSGTPMDAVVALLGANSSDAVRKAANIAARLSAKHCFFCAAPAAHEKGAVGPIKVDWSKIQPCACLADLRKDRVFHRPAETPADLIAILEAVDSRELRDSAEVYTTSCRGTIPAIDPKTGSRTVTPCDSRFTIRAGSLAHAVRGFLAHTSKEDGKRGLNRTALQRLELFKLPAKCRVCRDRTRQSLEKTAAKAGA